MVYNVSLAGSADENACSELVCRSLHLNVAALGQGGEVGIGESEYGERAGVSAVLAVLVEVRIE